MLSVIVVEICEGGFKSSVGIPDEDILVSLALCGWHQPEKTFSECLVHVFIFFEILFVNCPRIFNHLVLDGVTINVWRI